jgi:fucose permease
MDNHAKLKLINFIAMAQHGVLLLVFGPMVPEIMETFHIGESMTGLLLSMGAFGFAAGPVFAGMLIDKSGLKRVFLIGFGLEILFFLVFGFAPIFVVAAGTNLFLHFASSFVETSCNVMPTVVENDHASSYMSFVHFFFSVGAFISPFLVGLFISATGLWQPVFLILAIPTAVLLVYICFLPFPKTVHEVEVPTGSLKTLFETLRDKVALFGALTLLFYVGGEVGLSTWIAYYLKTKLGFNTVTASSAVSILWIGIMVGRFSNRFFTRKFSSRFLVTTTGLSGMIAGFLLLALESVFGVFPCLFFIGLCMAGIFPNVMAEINSRKPERTGTVTGVMSLGAGLGAMISGWLMGVISEHVSITIALTVPAILMGLLVISYWLALKIPNAACNKV